MAFPQKVVPPKRCILIHDGRRGLTIHRFSSRRDLNPMGLFVHDDLNAIHRDLLRFLQITAEWNDHIILREEPADEGEWK